MRAAILLGSALVLVRSAVFVLYEQAHFDSDQAVVGLMALHIGRLEAFPLYFYGQQYLAAYYAWLAAPVLLLGGASVTALKAPLVLLNVAFAALLIRLLVRDVRLSPAAALIASMFVILPPPVVASRLVEATGASIEPLLFVLLLWVVRYRPFAFGAVFALGLLNREFTAYAAVAWVLTAAACHPWRPRAAGRFAARAALAFAAVSAWPVLARIGDPSSAVHAGPALSLDVSELGERARFIAGLLPELVGAASTPLRDYNIASGLVTGGAWMGLVVLVAGGVAAGRLVFRRWTMAVPVRHALPLYLVLIGMQAVAAPLLVAAVDAMQIRYVLLALLAPVALFAVFFAAETKTSVRNAVAVLVIVWTWASLVDHARLIHEYRAHRPPNVFRELALYLEENGVRYARADYWTAYHVTFLTGERVIVRPDAVSRIAAYDRALDLHGADAVIQDTPCAGGLHLRRWHICRTSVTLQVPGFRRPPHASP
ncbi:MAG TPA: hypothetical protein VM364_07165 [Vicinamibacterales bacterium]|nr:hypothetical protein [Vicinamibacterales bacterium]